MIENKDCGLGKCVFKGCTKYAIVGLNGANLCGKHMTAFFDSMEKHARQIRGS